MVRLITPNLVSLLVVLLVDADRYDTVLPICKQLENILVELLFNIRIFENVKRRLLVHQFFAVENDWIIGMGVEVMRFQRFHLGEKDRLNMAEFHNNAGQAKKAVVRVIGAFQVGVADLIYVDAVFQKSLRAASGESGHLSDFNIAAKNRQY